MRDVPECLNKRYKALDELIKELGSNGASNAYLDGSSEDPEIKLMCEFWNILKEDPGVNLKQAVQERMGLNAISSGLFGQHVGCYMAGGCNKDNDETQKDEPLMRIKNVCKSCDDDDENSKTNTPNKITVLKTSDPLPLNKALSNLKEAASFEKKCQGKAKELLENQKQLQNQIEILEHREKDGMKLLKQADCMWSCMEELYKRKIAESSERQQFLLKQLKEIEANNKKWRINKKDLEFEMENIIKCHQEIIEQINHKTNDVKYIDLEINNFKNRIETDKKDIELALKSLTDKKKTSDGKIATMATEITKLKKALDKEQKYKVIKEEEGRKYVRDARDDLQKLCKVLLRKNLEHEDMKAEREALILEFEILKQSSDQCKEKCKIKQESILDEIKSIEKEIAEHRVRCIRCHECTDTMDVRKLCTDCPRCISEQECLQEEGHCSPDHTMDCVCMTVKQKFLDNVFDNMYTLLERQVKTGQGNAVAEAVVNCLKKSRNGKINDETKKLLQEFILTTIRSNLKLTIVGGAVKTRCEMDPETYKQLMLCLKGVKVIVPPKVDEGTDSKKDPCERWGGSSQCNCPNGPKECVCVGKGLLPSSDAQTCPPQVQGKKVSGEVVMCPRRGSVECGAECAVRDAVDSTVAGLRPHACRGPTCNFKNMRAAQCVLGPEVLSTVSGPGSISPNNTSVVLSNQATCKCSGSPTIPCVCHKDLRSQPRERIIQEVMGRLTDVTPIEKVVSKDGNIRKLSEEKNLNKERFGEMPLLKQNNLPYTSPDKSFQYYSKQLKSGIADVCDKNNCESIETENIHDTDKHITSEKILVKQVNKELTTKRLKFVYEEKNKLANTPKILKTSLGELRATLDKKLLDLLNTKMKKNCNLCTKLKNTNAGEDSVDHFIDLNYTKTTTSDKKPKILAKKSPSGNFLLEVHKSLLNYEEKSKETSSSTKTQKSTKENIKNRGVLSDIFNLKVKGAHNNEKEPLFALKATNSGNFEIVLDKEFEKWYKKTIKDHKGEDIEQYMPLTKTDSGNFIINLENNNENQLQSKSALLVKSESGNLKVIMSEDDSGSLRKDLISKSVISPRTFNDLLNKLPTSSRQFLREKLKKTCFISERSSSDSHIYGKTKFNFNNEQYFYSEQTPVLKKTSSGQFAVILNKDSKKSFVNNLKNYLTTSSKGLVPVKKTDSGNIYVDLSNNAHCLSNYGLVKLTPSGNIYITFDAQTAFPLNNINRSSQNVKIDTNLPFSTKKNSPCKEFATTCKPRDLNECNRKNVCYKSKKWLLQSKDGLSETHPCGQKTLNIKNDLKPSSDYGYGHKKSKSKCLHNLESIKVEDKSPHTVIKPCRCQRILEKTCTEDCYCFIQSISPYRINVYEKVSNKLLEISGLCSETKSINEANLVHNKKGKNVLYSENTTKRRVTYWDSLELLPPQLPLFLRDYN